MTKRNTARHRATPAKGQAVEALSQAVVANAGSLGRSAAVVAATSGLVLTMTPAANAAPVQSARISTTLPAAPNLENATKVDTVSGVSAESSSVSGITVETGRPAEVPVSAEVAEPEVEEVEAQPAANEQADNAEADLTPTVAPQNRAASQQSQQSNNTRSNNAQAQQSTAAPASSAPAAPAASGKMSAVVSAAYSGIGRPYVYGGKTPAGWDCSGFTAWAYAQAGISIPSQTSAMRHSGKFTRVSTPQPGDLVFQNGGTHVGIYVGNGQMIGAQNPSVGTILHSVSRNPLMGYYRYNG